MDKIKILYTISSLSNVGPVVQLYNIVKYIDREKFDVSILTLSENPVNSLLEDFKNLDINIFELPLNRWNVSNKEVLNLISKIQPNIIHSSGIRADRISTLVEKKHISIATVHNFMYEDYKYTYGNVLGSIMINRHLKYLGLIDFPVTCSTSINHKYLEKGLGIDLTISNGVDVDKFNVVEKLEKERLKKKLKIAMNKTVFISTGNLTKLKDPEIVANAFIKSSIYDKSILIFLGDGVLREQMEKKYEKHNNIYFFGRVKNVLEYLQLSDVFVSASHSEGLPNALLEAMSCNLSLLISDIDSHKQVYQLDNVDYISFPIQNESKLIKAFEKSINLQNNNNLINNRRVILEEFSAKKMSERYQKLYIRTNNKKLKTGN